MTASVSRRILVLAPHVDDAEFGIGAAMYRWSGEGAHIRVVIAAWGDYVRSDGRRVFWSERMMEGRKALEHLGVQEVVYARWMHENRGLEMDYAATVSAIEAEIRRFGPHQVFIPLPSFNQDHRALHDAAITALRPGCMVRQIYAYEYPGNVWGPTPPEGGKTYIRVGDAECVRKQQALNMHESQFAERFAAVGPGAAMAMLAMRGAEAGTKYAELTYLLRSLE